MSLSSASLKVTATAKVEPDTDSTISGRVTHSINQTLDLSDSTTAIQFRAIFSASSQTATVSTATGAIILSASGVRQVETATVTAAAGCTTSGNLTLTLTAAAVTGSPLTIEVPITTTAHTTAALIAAACAKKINATAAVTSKFTCKAVGSTIVLTRIGGYANDSTLNLAIAGELGVTAAASSANTTSGTAGVIIERLGGDGNNVYGEDLPFLAGFSSLVVKSDSSSSSYVILSQNTINISSSIAAGGIYVHSEGDGSSVLLGSAYPLVITSGGAAVVDVLAIAV